jgi:integrase
MKTVQVLDKVLKGKRVRGATQRHYREVLSSLAEYSEEWPVRGAVINEWLASLSGFADTTLKMWFEVVNSAGRYMKKAYRLKNPCEEAEKPKISKRKRRYFSPEEMVSVIKACVNDYELLLVLTLIDSACRIGELVNLSGGCVGDGFIEVMGKTGQRRYRLDARICERLRLLAGGEELPVFKCRGDGFYPDGNSLGHRVRRIIERAGIKGLKLGAHTLRHSSASLLAQESGQALIVKALLQHDDIHTSMGYIHDVDDLVIKDDKYSPLRLLGKRYGERAQSKGDAYEQMELTAGESGESVALVPVSRQGIVEVDGASLVGDLFPEVKEGVAVRAVLRAEDLSLLREAFVFYALYHDGNKVARARALMRRMLRKGGSERYGRVK